MHSFACNFGLQIKTESGAKLRAKSSGIYKRWKEKSHSKVSLRGTNDGPSDGAASSSGASGFRGDNRRFEGGISKRPVANAHVRSEIKDLNQVSKDRLKKADRVSYLKSQQGKKGKKFGKNIKRGKSSSGGSRGKSDDRGKSGFKGRGGGGGGDDRGKSGFKGRGGGGDDRGKGGFKGRGGGDDNRGKSGFKGRGGGDGKSGFKGKFASKGKFDNKGKSGNRGKAKY